MEGGGRRGRSPSSSACFFGGERESSCARWKTIMDQKAPSSSDDAHLSLSPKETVGNLLLLLSHSSCIINVPACCIHLRARMRAAAHGDMMRHRRRFFFSKKSHSHLPRRRSSSIFTAVRSSSSRSSSRLPPSKSLKESGR